jgi:hypothetical protein
MEITRKEVEQLIEVRRAESFTAHVFGLFNHTHKIVGDATHKAQIKLWQHVKVFVIPYAVFTFSFDANNHLTEIQTRMNSLLKVFLFVLFGAIVSFFAYKNVELWENRRFWIYVLLECLFLGLLATLVAKTYLFERTQQLEAFCNRLDMEIEDKPRKKSKVGAILVRCVTYPIGLGTLYFAIMGFLPEGDFIKAFFAIGVVMIYFITDVILMFQQKN